MIAKKHLMYYILQHNIGIKMDKTTVIDVKNDQRPVLYRYTSRMPEFNSLYGLWIISFRRGGITAARDEIVPRCFEFYGLSHLLEGAGWYWRQGERRVSFEKGFGVLSTPGTVQDYNSSDGNYVEDSICFAGPVADQLFNSGIIDNGIVKLGLERRLLPVFEMSEDPSRDAQIKANFALQKLLIDIYFEAKLNSDYDDYPGLTLLIEKINQNPERWWNGSEMAELCNLSENQFRVVFSRRTGMTPKLYIDQVKIKRASELLCNTRQSVSLIAEMLGYLDQYHFSRRFKRLTGMSPTEYRRHYTI